MKRPRKKRIGPAPSQPAGKPPPEQPPWPKREPTPRPPEEPGLFLDWLAIALVAAGFLLRWHLAGLTYFELDEAYHVRLSIPGFPELWRTMHEPTHPPLLIFLLHWVRKLGSSEYVLRAIPVICGTLFPWFIYRWLGLVWSARAGFVALAILEFSPDLVHLSAVVRQYTLGLLWLSLALYFLERSYREREKCERWTIWYSAVLWLGVISLFPLAFFCAPLGVYVLLRWRETVWTPKARKIWAAGQAVCVLTYVHLYIRQIGPLRESHQKLVGDPEAYFRDAFPRPWETVWGFAAKGTYGVFDLVFGWGPATWAAIALVTLALVLLGLRMRKDGVSRSLGMAMLLATPIALACAAAFLRTHPYGRTRQTIVLAVCIAAGVGIAGDWLLRRKTALVSLAVLAAVPVWYWRGAMNPVTWSPPAVRQVMWDVADYIRAEIPKGSSILMETPAALAMSHYLGKGEWPGRWRGAAHEIGGYWISGGEELSGYEDAWRRIEQWRQAEWTKPGETVWVLDMAYCALCRLKSPETEDFVRNAKRWGEVATLIPVPPDAHPPEAPPAAKPQGSE